MDDVIVAREFVASVGDAVVVESLPVGGASRGCTVSLETFLGRKRPPTLTTSSVVVSPYQSLD